MLFATTRWPSAVQYYAGAERSYTTQFVDDFGFQSQKAVAHAMGLFASSNTGRKIFVALYAPLFLGIIATVAAPVIVGRNRCG